MMAETMRLDIGIRKKGFETNNGAVFYLDTSDVNAATRFSEKQGDLQALHKEHTKVENNKEILEKESGEKTFEEIAELGKELREIDNKVKEITDYIFDTGVSEAIWGRTFALLSIDTVYDTLFGLYEKDVAEAMRKSKVRIDKALPEKYKNNNYHKNNKKRK